MNKVPNTDIAGRPIIETPGILRWQPAHLRNIWGLERARRNGWSDLDLLENYPTINQADLEIAWGFVDVHRERIEQEIGENNGAA